MHIYSLTLRPTYSGVRILIFSNPQLFLSGYGYRPHVSGESTANPGKNESALQSGKK